GEEVRVIVGAQRGQIISVRPVIPVAAPYGPPPRVYDPYYGPPGYVPMPEYYPPDARYDPRPPAAVPRVNTAPRDTGAAKPAAKATTAPPPKAAVATRNPAALPPAPKEPAETSASAPAKPDSASSTAEVKTEKKDA